MIHNRHIRQHELFTIQIRQKHGSIMTIHDTQQTHMSALTNHDTNRETHGSIMINHDTQQTHTSALTNRYKSERHMGQ
jgi:hypothetical protein